jgi:pectinesterase
MNRYITLFLTLLLFSVITVETYAQQASATWALSNPTAGGTGLTAVTSGTVVAVDEKLKGTEINGYTGTGSSQRIRMAGTNNSWAANLTAKIDTVYVQFAVSPKTGSTFSISNLSLSICAASTQTMKAAIYYSTDADFKNPTEVTYTTGGNNNYLLSNALTPVTATPNITVPSGGTFYLRVYPWHESASVSTGKYMCLQNVIISGTSVGAPTPFSATWPYETDDKVVTKGGITADQSYNPTMKFYGFTTLPTVDGVNLKVGAVQTTSKTWKAEPNPTDTLHFQYAVSPKTGGTLNITSISMYLGGWFSSNLRAAVYYSKDATFATKTLLIPDSALVGNKVAKLNSTVNVTVNSGETFYLRVYPHNKAAEGWAKLVAVDSVVIAGTGSGVNADAPAIKTTDATYISTTFVSTGGTVTNDGGADVTARGVCWNTNGSPTTANSKLEGGSGVGQYTSSVTGLTANTKYYLRAYATNSAGISYGNEITFTTLAAKVVPTVTTTAVTSILAKTAASGGSVTEWGGDPVTARGICWSTKSNPTVSDSKTVNGQDLGSFTSMMSDLKPNTVYYVRAYATNGIGSGYGNEVSFTTQAQAANVKKVVAADGSGDYKTVQAAFDAIPENYTGTWTVFVKNGTYKEKISLTALKSNVVLEGENRDKTILVYDDYSGRVVNGVTLGTSTCQTVAIDASDFLAKNITFQNTSTAAQAVALRIQGDRHAYYNCKLLGYQDTYYTWGGSGVGRVYMKNCYIEGSVDFIFGRDVVVFDRCSININRNGGTLTAASTDATTLFGYVFLNCKITANEIGFDNNPITSFVLGRPWQNAPRTVFIKCEEPATLSPAGWSTWNVTPAVYAEYKCFGPGSDTKQRLASISRQLTDQEAATYTVANILSKNTSPAFSYDWMPDTTIVTSIEEEELMNSLPTKYELYQNYPNPFNPTTSIKYQLPKNGKVKISVYDILGSEIYKLVNEEQAAGSYEVKFNAANLASGVYFYRIEASDFIQSKKMILLK